MDWRAGANALSHQRDFQPDICVGSESLGTITPGAVLAPNTVFAGPFLRVPPFPRARVSALARARVPGGEQEQLADLVRDLKVGGCYWGRQPNLPAKYILVRGAGAMSAGAVASDSLVLWNEESVSATPAGTIRISGECDPWHMLAGATMLVTDAQDELCLIALLLGVPVFLHVPLTGSLQRVSGDSAALASEALSQWSYRNPFTGEPMSAREALELCGFWRELIDRNRDIAGGVGFAFWKQDHVAPLLWGGGEEGFVFHRSAREITRGVSVAIWRSRVGPDDLATLNRREGIAIEVEDGFLRSNGLGADCVPPLSITVDRLGAYFDPARPSQLEMLLETGTFDDEMLGRARRLRQLIVAAGLGKYEQSKGVALGRPQGKRRHILVPGQVEDDRAVLSGGCGLVSNLDLLAKVRADAPDAYIIYKPHPDVLAGHRRGAIPERLCLEQADEIAGSDTISGLIDMVDEVHVNTSLAGFEALLRNKRVTTYGVPFYAGWGLTRDLGPVPARRTSRRSIDELVAAALLMYPRYLDPVTGLPCPVEVIVDRLMKDKTGDLGLVVRFRRLQGKLMKALRRVAQ